MTETDTEERERQLRKAQERRARAENRREKAEHNRSSASRRAAFRRSEGGLQKGKAVKSMFISSAILICFVLFFEVALVVHSHGWGDLDTHLLNMADNTLAFVIGLGAMDAVVYFNTIKRDRRNELLAIDRHHRLMEPMIEAFIFRKNILTASVDENIRQYDIIGEGSIAGLARMFDASYIATDAGISRIRVYSQQQKQLYKSMQKLVEDVNFTYFPEIGDAALAYLKASTAGFSALTSLLALESDTHKTKRESLVKAIEAEAAEPSVRTNPKIVAASLLLSSIREQEKALDDYLGAYDSVH